MDPDVAAARVGEAHEYIASFVDEHGTGPFADKVRELRGQALSPAAREVRDASALAAVVELLATKTGSMKKSIKK